MKYFKGAKGGLFYLKNNKKVYIPKNKITEDMLSNASPFIKDKGNVSSDNKKIEKKSSKKVSKRVSNKKSSKRRSSKRRTLSNEKSLIYINTIQKLIDNKYSRKNIEKELKEIQEIIPKTFYKNGKLLLKTKEEIIDELNNILLNLKLIKLENTEHKIGMFRTDILKVNKIIGRGGQGSILSGTFNNIPIVIKAELKGLQTSSLNEEYRLLNILRDVKGIPKVYSLDVIDGVNLMVMEFLGVNVYQISQKINLSEKDIKYIGKNIAEILSKIHSHNIIHRDIKPSNIMFKNKDLRDIQNKEVYVIDFGSSFELSKWASPVGGFFGSPEFSSVNILKNIPASFKDDYESLGYLLLFLCCKNEITFFNEKLKSLPEDQKIEKIIPLKESFLKNYKGTNIPDFIKKYFDTLKNYKDEKDFQKVFK